MKSALLVLLASFALTSCSDATIRESSFGPISVQSADVKGGMRSPSYLNAHAEDLDGSAVLVHGFLIEESENHALWDSQDSPAGGGAARCVSVLYTKDVSRKVARMNRKSVILSGTFKRDITSEREVFLGLCNRSAILLNRSSQIEAVP